MRKDLKYQRIHQLRPFHTTFGQSCISVTMNTQSPKRNQQYYQKEGNYSGYLARRIAQPLLTFYMLTWRTAKVNYQDCSNLMNKMLMHIRIYFLELKCDQNRLWSMSVNFSLRSSITSPTHLHVCKHPLIFHPLCAPCLV